MITSNGSASFTPTQETSYTGKEHVLKALAAGELGVQEAMALLAKFERASGGGTLKVSQKGAIQFRGVPGISVKFGLTLYGKTLEWLYANRETVERFIADHRDELAWSKPAKAATSTSEPMQVAAEAASGDDQEFPQRVEVFASASRTESDVDTDVE